MVSLRSVPVWSMLSALATMGCSLVNAPSDHLTLGPPQVRVVHLARDTATIDVIATGAGAETRIASSLAFSAASTPVEVAPGPLTFRISREGETSVLVETTETLEVGREYTLTVYGDEVDVPFDDRVLGVLWLEDDAAGLDATNDIRLVAIHVATPVREGQLVSVTPDQNVLLASQFEFRAVADLPDLRSGPYVVGFDALADGIIDLDFDLPRLVPGTYANVFVASAPDDSVFLLVNTQRGGATQIIPANE